MVEKLSPYLPYLGILSGGVMVGKHVIKKHTQPTKQNKKSTEQPSTSTEDVGENTGE